MANSILAKMAVQISANTAEFNKGISQASGSLSKFGSDIKSIAATIGVAFSAKEIASFVLESNKLVGTFDGVKRAFDNLPNSELLMRSLKDATHGTVNELNLMQQSLRAKNFGINVKDLSTYLEFAAIRAQQTGESVDYMVNSIILGLGRGSIKILDNLQVNIAKIKDTVKETGVSLQEAFRQQVVEQMKSIGKYAENSKTQVERLEEAFYNLRLEASRKFESSNLIKFLTDQVKSLQFLIKAGGNPFEAAKLQEQAAVEEKAIISAKKFTDALTGTYQDQTESLQKEVDAQKAILEKRNKEILEFQKQLQASFSLGLTGFINKTSENQVGRDRLDELKKREGFVGGGTFLSREDIAARERAIQAYKAEIEVIKSAIPEMIKDREERQKFISVLSEYKDNLDKNTGSVKKYKENIDTLTKELELLEDIKKEATGAELAQTNREIQAIKEKIKALEEYGILSKKQAKENLESAARFIPPKDSGESVIFGPSVEEQFNAVKFALAKISQGFDAVQNSAKNAFSTISDGVDKAAKAVLDVGPSIASAITDIADALGQASTGGENFGRGFIKAMARFAQQFGALLIAAGVGKVALESFSGPGMIAAGAALVAIGGAIGQVIASRPGGGGNTSGGTRRDFTRADVNNNYQNYALTTQISGTNLNVVMGNQANRNNSTVPQWR